VKKQKHIILAVLILTFLIPIGFYSKLYSGPAHEWVNNKSGGVLYEIFWCLVFYILIRKAKPKNIALWVFTTTCILEFLQLLDNSLLELIRSDFIGRTIIGSSFSWSDFMYYFIGSIIGYFILNFLENKKAVP
jgi:Protein of unknown function (DUF2809)